MNISGMLKLRLIITTLFILSATVLVFSYIIGTVDADSEREFSERLTWDDYYALNEIYDKYPSSTFVIPFIIYEMVGWFMIIMTGMLFVLTIKVWFIHAIY